MKVLLIADVKNLGKAGEIKDVKDGYGQNFLVSKGLARVATEAVIKQYAAHEKERQAHELAHKTELLALAQKLAMVSIKIVKKVGANGSLFGALKKEDIAEALKTAGCEIDKKDIEMDVIKAVGVYEIGAKIGYGLHPKFKVEVASE